MKKQNLGKKLLNIASLCLKCMFTKEIFETKVNYNIGIINYLFYIFKSNHAITHYIRILNQLILEICLILDLHSLQFY